MCGRGFKVKNSERAEWRRLTEPRMAELRAAAIQGITWATITPGEQRT